MAIDIEPRSYLERRILMMDLVDGDKIGKKLKKIKLTPALKRRINRLLELF